MATMAEPARGKRKKMQRTALLTPHIRVYDLIYV